MVGQVVAQDYRTATVFKTHQIDFCCRGNRTIDGVCKQNNLETDKFIDELNLCIQNSANHSANFHLWDIDLLTDYIEKNHHRYVEKRIPELKTYLNKIARVHGGRHPELIEVDELFSASAYDLLHHMEKEETILFPFVRKMAAGVYEEKPQFGAVINPISVMREEHDNEGVRFRKIAKLTNNFTPPEDACTTYRVAFEMLKEFEEDLHQHIHLENNILFPKAVAAENKYQLA
ncbi:MAG: iron-sulfur cluster repair di-iron protein [Bacteroidia bacterium]